MHYLKIIIILLLFNLTHVKAQKSLRVLRETAGGVKRYDFYVNDVLEYKLKKQHRFHSEKIVNITDSLVVFKNDSVIAISQIKAVRMRDYRHLMNVFGKAFTTAGIGFITLNTINNAISDIKPLVNENAVKISAGLIGTGLVMRYFSVKRIHINKRTTIKTMDTDFSDLNVKK